MNESKLKLLVTEAVELDRAIAADLEILKGLKSQISAEAKARKDEATKTDGGGHSIIFEGIDGCVCRITKAAPGLKGSIDSESQEWQKIRGLSIRGNDLDELFSIGLYYRPIAEFRTQAKKLLEDDLAKKLIKLCQNDPKTTVSFETKEAAT